MKVGKYLFHGVLLYQVLSRDLAKFFCFFKISQYFSLSDSDVIMLVFGKYNLFKIYCCHSKQLFVSKNRHRLTFSSAIRFRDRSLAARLLQRGQMYFSAHEFGFYEAGHRCGLVVVSCNNIMCHAT